MTRINLVPPEELYDQHLMAEYRETLMVPAALKKSLKSKTPIVIPPEYLLGSGHIKFFYDKGLYLHKRYESLIAELKKRGFNLDDSRVFPISVYPGHYYNDWEPSEKDYELIRARLAERVAQKPQWYRKTTY